MSSVVRLCVLICRLTSLSFVRKPSQAKTKVSSETATRRLMWLELLFHEGRLFGLGLGYVLAM